MVFSTYKAPDVVGVTVAIVIHIVIVRCGRCSLLQQAGVTHKMSSDDKGPTMRKQTTEKSDSEKEVGVTSSALSLEFSKLFYNFIFKTRITDLTAQPLFGEVACCVSCHTIVKL